MSLRKFPGKLLPVDSDHSLAKGNLILICIVRLWVVLFHPIVNSVLQAFDIKPLEFRESIRKR